MSGDDPMRPRLLRLLDMAVEQNRLLYDEAMLVLDAVDERSALWEKVTRAEAERDALAAKVERVSALAERAKREEATSLSRTFDGGTFGAWIDADRILAALGDQP